MKTKTQPNSFSKTRAGRRWALVIALGAIAPFAIQTPTASADEFHHRSEYYEDDAWWDVSEWFDGNDYNPTDEAIGRWDDEIYDTADALNSSDSDNDNDNDRKRSTPQDRNVAVTTADDKSSDKLFYDYYKSGYSDYSDYDGDGYWDYTATYFDYDADGVFDSVAEHIDTDNDGVYDKHNFVAFSNSNSDAEQEKESRMKAQDGQKEMSSQVVSRQGTIQSFEKVKTRRGTNLVVVLSDTQQGENVLVDLGSASQYDSAPKKGQDLSVKGATFKTGDNTILLASKATCDGEERTIDRSGRKFTGTIEDMKTLKVRGTTHQIAKIKTDKGKKLLVDLGPQDKLKLDVENGSQLTVSGPAVKVKDRMMLIARQLTSNGESTEIQRTALKQ